MEYDLVEAVFSSTDFQPKRRLGEGATEEEDIFTQYVRLGISYILQSLKYFRLFNFKSR